MEYHQNGAPTLIQILSLLTPIPFIDPSYLLSNDFQKTFEKQQQIFFTKNENSVSFIKRVRRSTGDVPRREAQRYHEAGDLRRGLASIRYNFYLGI